MASSRQPARKPLIVTPKPSKPKPTITLDEWESKTQLSADQIKSVTQLKEACEVKPLPLKFQDANGTPRPSTPVVHLKATLAPGTPASRPNTPTPVPSRLKHPTPWKQPLSTPEQFHDWFSTLERAVSKSQESHFHAHLESVTQHLEKCNHLLEVVQKVESEVDGMLQSWQSVEEGGKSLKDDCERLLEEKDELLEISDAIASRLEYFQELEGATRILNRPGESIVLNPDFLLMVERVDICLEYLKEHRQFKESELYILRYQQCLTRAMTLIQLHFVNSLKTMTADIQKRLADQELSSAARTHLIYTKFQSMAPSVAPLISELERRVKSHESDLSSLLTESHISYCNARKTLLVGMVAEEIRGLDPSRSDLIALTRSGCTYLKVLCQDEFNLYRQFFSSGEHELYAYLESLCDYLYDDLRPRILHEQRLQTLCDVCTILQGLMVPDVDSLGLRDPDASEDDDSDNDQLTIEFDNKFKEQPFALRKLQVGHLLQMILQDAQTRLVFRAQAVLQADVKFYLPKGDDLDYPVKLREAMLSGPHEKQNGNASNKSILPLSSTEKQGIWYPSVRKTFAVISQLHDCVKPMILSDIAQEAIILCSQSLLSASQIIIVKNPPQSKTDGLLFLIRHLLILKEMTANLDFDSLERPPENITMADALSTLFKGASTFTNSKLLTNFGLSPSTDSLLDARMVVDKELRDACEALIDHCATTATAPIRAFVEQCSTLMAPSSRSDTKNKLSLQNHDFAKPEKLLEIHENFKQTCEREISWWMKQLLLYLENDRSAMVLVAPLQSQIVEEYTKFRDIVRMECSAEVQERLMSLTDLWAFLKQICRLET